VKTEQKNFSPEAKDIINIVVINTVRPNLTFNQEATDLAIRNAIEAVQRFRKPSKQVKSLYVRANGSQRNRLPCWNNWACKKHLIIT
jgi:hypothetical protein